MGKYAISVSPHINDKSTTSRIMLDVLIALVPSFIASILIFGPRAAVVTFVCVASCVFFEWGYLKIVKKPNPLVIIRDYSACITGVILAFNLPVTIPIWQAVVGSAVAIILVKQLFGGLGKNIFNPAETARVFMFIAFATTMTTWVKPLDFSTWVSPSNLDGLTAATPLALIKHGDVGALPGVWEMFIGVRGGCLGETSNLALLIGGIYLMFRRVISWHTPVAYIAMVAAFSALLGFDPVYQIFGGGLFLGAIFMATDYVTAPQTKLGQLIFGVMCGFFTVIIRVYSNYPEGVSFSILFMNILTPYINKLTETKPLGGVKK